LGDVLLIKRIFIKILILACLGYFLGTKAEAVNALSWPLARHDSKDSACSNAEGPNIPQLKWKKKLDGRIFEEPVVNSRGWVYAAAGNSLYGFDVEGNELFSSISLAEEVYSEKIYSLGLSADERALYVGLETKEGAAVAAFDAEHGFLKWFFSDIAGDAVESFNVSGNILYFGTKLGLSGEGGKFYALKDEGSCASLLWEVEPFKDWNYISFPFSSPIHGDGLFIAAVGKDSKGKETSGVLAVDKNSGRNLWQDAFVRSNNIFKGPIIVEESGKFFYWVGDEYLFIHNTSDGSNFGYYNLKNKGILPKTAPAAADKNGNIFLLVDSSLVCLNSKGELLFKTELQNNSFTLSPNSPPIVDSRGHIYFGDSVSYGDSYGSIYAVDEKGSLKWRFDTDALIASSPVLSPDGSIIFGNIGGNLFVVRDRKPFDLQVIYPRDGSYVGGAVPFLIEIRDEGDWEVDKVRVFVDGFLNEAVMLEEERYYWEWDASKAVTGTVYSIEVMGEDYSGAQKSFNLNLTIDNAVPTGNAFYDGEYKEGTASITLGDTVKVYGSSFDQDSGVKRIILLAQNIYDGSHSVVGWAYNDGLEDPFSWEIIWTEMPPGIFKLYCLVEDRTYSAEKTLFIPGIGIRGNFCLFEVLSKEGHPLLFKWEEKIMDDDDEEDQEFPGDEPQNKSSRGRGRNKRKVQEEKSFEEDLSEIEDNLNLEIHFPFDDLTEGKETEIVGFLWQLGAVKGYPGGVFQPHRYVTRMEFIKMLAVCLELKPEENISLDFKDAQNIPYWGKPFIGALVKRGIIIGYPDKTIKIRQNLNYGEMELILERVLSCQGIDKELGCGHLVDVLLKEKGNLWGKDPNASVTRMDAASVLFYFIDMEKK